MVVEVVCICNNGEVFVAVVSGRSVVMDVCVPRCGRIGGGCTITTSCDDCDDDAAGACTSACAPARCSPSARDLDDNLWDNNNRAFRTLDADAAPPGAATAAGGGGAAGTVSLGCCSCSCTCSCMSSVSNNAT